MVCSLFSVPCLPFNVVPQRSNVVPPLFNVIPLPSNVVPLRFNVIPQRSNLVLLLSNLVPLLSNLVLLPSNVIPSVSNVVQQQSNLVPLPCKAHRRRKRCDKQDQTCAFRWTRRSGRAFLRRGVTARPTATSATRSSDLGDRPLQLSVPLLHAPRDLRTGL